MNSVPELIFEKTDAFDDYEGFAVWHLDSFPQLSVTSWYYCIHEVPSAQPGEVFRWDEDNYLDIFRIFSLEKISGGQDDRLFVPEVQQPARLGRETPVGITGEFCRITDGERPGWYLRTGLFPQPLYVECSADWLDGSFEGQRCAVTANLTFNLS